ncbi:MAG: ribbon-helix-helix protein, CopG family [Paludibacteraceae bacterium]|nr:ribbon-helix-helix protein, CopG family [Paludibacteraceae bacterium]MBQ2438735.1 ribbon-helix-helix protein, CopG family [Paludibacteraceae bacterium]MBQ9752432.1 ribbon-helix-helix protein, CopG family [Paludibacteraceae bacterium]MBR1995852.1 ribbon-helix-helix protein, CopG family [Paludibacteraceae bacterium]
MKSQKPSSFQQFSRSRVREARTNRVSILLNDSEMRALDRYCEKYGVRNRSRVVREALMRSVLKQFEKDAPTLFD